MAKTNKSYTVPTAKTQGKGVGKATAKDPMLKGTKYLRRTKTVPVRSAGAIRISTR